MAKTEATTRDDLEKLVKAELKDALSFMDSEIIPVYDEASSFFHAELPEQKAAGRSAVVVPVVRYVCNLRVAQTLRVASATANPCEFSPVGPEDVENAKLLTEKVKSVYERDNNGTLLDYVWLQESNRYGLSVAELETEEVETASPAITETLSPDEYAFLADQSEVDVLSAEVTTEGFYEVTFKRIEKENHYRINIIPREQFFFSSDCTYDLSTGQIKGSIHGVVVEKTIGEFVADGLDREDLEAISDEADSPLNDFASQFERHSSEHRDGDDRRVKIARCYLKLDLDGDGRPEHVEAVFAGSRGQGKLLSYRAVARVPLVPLIPAVEPHELRGRGAYDDARDGQRLKTTIMRLVLDNFYSTSTPRLVVNPYSVHMDDVLSPSINAPIRAENTADVHQLNQQFTGQAGFGLLEYTDLEVEQQTGVGRNTMALNADALQSPTATQAIITQSAHQLQNEVSARLFLEAKRTLFRLLAETMTEIEGVENELFQVRRDVRVNVGIGSGTRESQLMHLRELLGYQMQYVQQMGPQHMPSVISTLHRISEAMGYANPQAFFPLPSPEELARLAQPKADPAQAEAEQEFALKQKRLEMEMSFKAKELDLKAAEMQADAARKDREMNLKHEVRLRELELEYQLRLAASAVGSPESTNLPRVG